MRNHFLLCVTSLTAVVLYGAVPAEVRGREIKVTSPNGRVEISVDVNQNSATYTLRRNGQTIVEPSAIDIRLKDLGRLSDDMSLVDVHEKEIDASSPLPWGKVSTLVDHCREDSIRFSNKHGIDWSLQLRAYDDGVAFRYGFPGGKTRAAMAIESETTEFRLAANPAITFGSYDSFTTSHEPLYDRKLLAEVPTKRYIEMPLLAVWPDRGAAAITESRLRDYAGMYLERPENSATTLSCRLSPSSNEGGATHDLPAHSPWRVILLADQAGQLIENNISLCLNEPAEGDFSWAKPGKTTWHWWNGVVEHGATSTPDVNFAIAKKYIDFCAAHNIRYHSVIGVAESRPWYVQTGKPGYDPRPDTDILTPRPDLGMPRILDYAKQKGIGIRLWVHWAPLNKNLEAAFAKYEGWGIAGLMVDFMDRDDREMVQWQERCLQSAARHKLHIQFHGSYKFSGEQRTYPNLFNREGVLNLEYLKWTNMCDPPHDVDIAYTRLLAGPVDYHLGGFRAVTRSEFKPRDEKPVIMGTRCHQLALYVIYENPMPMVADYPEAYEDQPGFDFIEKVPTTWDETKYITGEPGQYVVVARRRGDAWYLGGITNWNDRQVKLPLSFLGNGTFAAHVRRDENLDGSNPNAIRQETRQVTSGETLDLTLASGGGVAIDFQPIGRR